MLHGISLLRLHEAFSDVVMLYIEENSFKNMSMKRNVVILMSVVGEDFYHLA